MEVVTLARQALFLSKTALALYLLQGCSFDEMEVPAVYTDAASVVSMTRGGVLYANGLPYSGYLFSLYPQSTDTAFVGGYVNGKAEGQHREYYPGGNPNSVRTFQQGRKEGQYMAWWYNGRPKLIYLFENDEYEGLCSEWAENGVIVRQMNYHLGREQGKQQAWDSEGKQLANYEVRNGRKYGITGVKGCATLWKQSRIVAR